MKRRIIEYSAGILTMMGIFLASTDAISNNWGTSLPVLNILAIFWSAWLLWIMISLLLWPLCDLVVTMQQGVNQTKKIGNEYNLDKAFHRLLSYLNLRNNLTRGEVKKVSTKSKQNLIR
jgi:hypothetical protein